MKILILGGYGTFGGRLARLLSDDPSLTLFIAGRSARKAKEFCERMAGPVLRHPVVFDTSANVQAQLGALAPDLVVDAAGPFQLYGEDPYRIVKAALASGIDYLDLADGSEFVEGIRGFDLEAKRLGRFVVSGASTFPVLTAASIRRLETGMREILTITGGIAPSPYAGVGANVLRAIGSYAGKKIELTKDGQRSYEYALTTTRRETIAPPGYLPLRSVLFSLVDVPDLHVLPALWPSTRTIWMGAGPVPEIWHRMLIALAWLVRLRMLPSLASLAPLFHFVANNVRWGEHRGGMFVRVTGIDHEGSALERSWHLIAEDDDGPLIPSMACEAIIRKIHLGCGPLPGARAATGELELADYESMFDARRIVTGSREERAQTERGALYSRLLGVAWAQLPHQIREMHSLTGTMRANGVAEVRRGHRFLARMAAAVVRFPVAGSAVPVSVKFKATNAGELWTRTFGHKSFSSFQSAGRGRSRYLLTERFGPLTFALALVVREQMLQLVVRRMSLGPIPLPIFLAPGGRAFESVENNRFCFDVEISHPWTGLIVAYRGWLVPEDSGPAADG